MPKRMLRDWTDSQKFDGISAEPERLFVRLIMKADDFGRYYGDVRIIRAHCFPLLDNLRPNDLDRWLDELSHRQLILRYEVQGRKYLAIVNYGQRLKNSNAKFPPPDGEIDDFRPVDEHFREVAGSGGKFPPEEEEEVEEEEEEKGRARKAPIPEILINVPGFLDEWKSFKIHRRKKRSPLTERAEELILRKLMERPLDAISAIQLSIERGWQGIEWEWFDNHKLRNGNNTKGKSCL